MKKLLSVLLVGIFTASIGASAFAAEAAATKDKLVAKNTTAQHKLMDKTHKSHKANKEEKSSPAHEVTK